GKKAAERAVHPAPATTQPGPFKAESAGLIARQRFPLRRWWEFLPAPTTDDHAPDPYAALLHPGDVRPGEADGKPSRSPSPEGTGPPADRADRRNQPPRVGGPPQRHTGSDADPPEGPSARRAPRRPCERPKIERMLARSLDPLEAEPAVA